LLPIAVLIGTIYSLARMAQASEYTILRTGGLGPGRALRLLATLGVAFGR
jgi:lipopolysaccharide export system permease protein